MKRWAAVAVLPLLLAGIAVTRAHAAASATPDHCDALLQDAAGNQYLQSESSFPSSSPDYYPAITDPATGYARHYCVYVPPHFDGGAVVLVLHGCYTDAPTVAYETQFNAAARRHGFIAIYPQEAAFSANPSNSAHPYDGNGQGPGKGSGCWNWHLPDQLQRASPEPVILTGIVTRVMSEFRADRRRIYVIGLSGGAAEANNLGVLYPDLFAATAVVAGCEYAGDPCLGSVSALPPQLSGRLAAQAAAGHARVMPFLVENGDIDPVVPVANALDDVLQWQTYDALASGTSAPASFCNHTSVAAGPVGPPNTADPIANPNATHGYDVYYYDLSGAPCTASPRTLGELWIVHGEIHAYPGGAPRRYYTTEDTNYDVWTDPLGPDLTDAAWRFFAAHPLPGRQGGDGQ